MLRSVDAKLIGFGAFLIRDLSAKQSSLEKSREEEFDMQIEQ
jgi:hypothetical protein